MGAKRPALEQTVDGLRFRAYSRRSTIEVLIGDGEVDDPAAEVWIYPKGFGLYAAIEQSQRDRRR